MVSIAGSKKLKRQMSPLFWGINRKNKRFAITVRPGSHPKNSSFPTAILLRDVLNVVTTLREAKSVIYGGKIKRRRSYPKITSSLSWAHGCSRITRSFRCI